MAALPHCRWMLTCWDVLDVVKRYSSLVEGTTDYLVYQLETTEAGRVHAQVYYQINDGSKGVSFDTMVERFGKLAHVEYARKSEAVCLDYVTKERSRYRGPFYLNVDKDYVDYLVAEAADKREEKAAVYAATHNRC